MSEGALQAASWDDSLFRDRRASIRLPAAFEVELTDHAYRWSGKGIDFSPEGCALQIDSLFVAGKRLRLRLSATWAPKPLEIDATVAHLTRGRTGLAFDLSEPSSFEETLDRYDRLQLSDASLGLLATRLQRRLQPTTVLSPVAGARGTGLGEGERRVLALIDGRRTLAQLRESLGSAWPALSHLPFSLLHRGQVSLRGDPTKAQAAPTAQAHVRPAQAERYLETAREMIRSGDRRQARLNLTLAASLAPGDTEIARLLAELE